VFAWCDSKDVADCALVGFPESVALEVHDENGFETYLFHEAEVSSTGSVVVARFVCRFPNKHWEGRWGLATFLDAIAKQSAYIDGLSVDEIELEDDWKTLILRTTLEPAGSLVDALNSAAMRVRSAMTQAEIALGGLTWRTKYETDEAQFCTQVLMPLLRRMGFRFVRYTHGTREYGKDFTFSELTPFGYYRHYGLQAKAGDVRGGVNAAIDEIIGQTKDAFEMPYYELGSKEARYISTFIVAISGRFTENAREKIVEKIPKGIIGSVYFIDRELLLELIERHWQAKQS